MESRSGLDFSSCKVISTREGEFFLLVKWMENTFDIYLTDVRHSWRQEGVSAPQGHVLAPKDWLLHAREALYDPDPTRHFRYDVEPDGSSMQLEWSAEYDGGQPIICLCTLEPSQDTTATLAYMLSHLCKSYKVLKRAVAQMNHQNAALSTELKSAQSQCQTHIEASKDRETELFVKFSLVLNSKKTAIQQLTEDLEEAQKRVKELEEQVSKEGGSATEDDAGSNPEADGGDGFMEPPEPSVTQGTQGSRRAGEPAASQQRTQRGASQRLTPPAASATVPTQAPAALQSQPAPVTQQLPAPSTDGTDLDALDELGF